MTNLTSGKHNECPTIYVSLGAGVDTRAYAWVEIGAEEEGVPCRLVRGTATDPVVLAHEAALESRLGVGVGIAHGRAALHEAHMPPGLPVWMIALDAQTMPACRLIGGNAGRMVKRMPLRLSLPAPLEPEIPVQRALRAATPPSPQPDMRLLTETIARRVLRQRGFK